MRGPSSAQGPIGFPIQRVLSGTDSPLITRDTGPTVACRPIVAAGRTTLFGPRVAPARRTTRSMLITRSWNRCVWTTQPALTVAPSRSSTRSGSGSQ